MADLQQHHCFDNIESTNSSHSVQAIPVLLPLHPFVKLVKHTVLVPHLLASIALFALDHFHLYAVEFPISNLSPHPVSLLLLIFLPKFSLVPGYLAH